MMEFFDRIEQTANQFDSKTLIASVNGILKDFNFHSRLAQSRRLATGNLKRWIVCSNAGIIRPYVCRACLSHTQLLSSLPLVYARAADIRSCVTDSHQVTRYHDIVICASSVTCLVNSYRVLPINTA